MKNILTALLLSITILSFGQTTMNIYQNNGTTVNLPVSTIDSVNFTTTPPPSRMNIYQMGGGIISIVIGNIDSITYTVQGTSGLAVLSTSPVTNINSTSAVSGGNVASDGGSPITQRGVVWSTTPNPTTANNNTNDGSGTGSFSSTLTGLTDNTTYYVRAYAANANGTAYGNEVSFTTLNSTSLPTVITDSVTTIDSISAGSGGNVTSDGGSPVTQRGVVWNTAPFPGPTLGTNLGFTNDGAGTGGFSSIITGLTPNTYYYMRSYAVNSAGIAYGNQRIFTSTSGNPNLAGDATYSIFMSGQINFSLGNDTIFNNFPTQCELDNTGILGTYSFAIDLSNLLGAPLGTFVPIMEGVLIGNSLIISNYTYVYQGTFNLVWSGTVDFDSSFNNILNTSTLTFSGDGSGTFTFNGFKN